MHANASLAAMVAWLDEQLDIPKYSVTEPDNTITCHDPGKLWTQGADERNAPNCSVVPTIASFVRHTVEDPASVDVTWRIWWTSNLGHNEPLGNVTRTAEFTVTIQEYQVTTS